MKPALLICLLLGALNGLSQTIMTISGKVTDMSNTEGIPDCLVQVNGTNIRVKTNEAGEYSLQCKSCTDTTSITFTRMNYFDEVRTLSTAKKKGSGISSQCSDAIHFIHPQ